ncbi:MAG TPA: MBL fold metallo-hydrolase, partial [Candidatus Krumholzibacteria bacterium]|nr:MBL fold metallo-hydrolase [Candidatus Krumholzibacteria bacterium]
MRTWLMRGACAVLLLAVSGCAGLAPADPTRFESPPAGEITFWGHACFYIDSGGTGIVTDPVFDRWMFLRHRFIGSPPPTDLSGTRVILISHAHPD